MCPDSPDPVLAAADLLWQSWQTGRAIGFLPAALRPGTRQAGYAVQARLEARSAQPLYGWKIAATSEAGQRHIGVSGPLAGRLLAERVHRVGEPFSMAGNRMAVAEPEFAWVLGADLAPGPQPRPVAAVMAAVDALRLAIEVPNSRFVDFVHAGEAQLIADNACAHDFLEGPEALGDWRTQDLVHHRVTASVTGRARTYTREGVGAQVLGDPRMALAWLVNELNAQGLTLRAGQVITTGTCMPPLEIEAGDEVLADFGSLGRVGARFID